MLTSPLLRSRLAFTLIELLVVISIIALLVGILLPALATSRETARMMKCTSNQRQLTLAMFAYQGDSDSQFPSYYYFGGAGQPWNGEAFANATWANVLQYMGYFESGAALMQCPSFGEGNKLDPSDTSMASLTPGHYGYNYRHIGSSLNASVIGHTSYGGNGDGFFIPATADFVLQATDTYLLMEAVRDLDVPNDPTRYDTGTYVVDSSRGSQFHPRPHHGVDSRMLAIAYADGHVATLEIENPASPYNDLGSYTPANQLYGAYTGPENDWDRK